MSRFCPQQKQGAAKFAHFIRKLRRNLLISFANYGLRQFVRKRKTNFGGSKICSFHSQTTGCGNLFVNGKPTSGAAKFAHFIRKLRRKAAAICS
uniref:Uncharacterized protein n=1 Tax=Tupiella akineta TaxID=160070 RepID=Q6UVQ2_TUPAK|nr:hypothetical protein PsakpMp59 [Tupiella akineta]AAQ18772.1 hypothetical protein [Tupiella akineta]